MSDFTPAALDVEALDDPVKPMHGNSGQFQLGAPLRGIGR
jgi:hypothetical protein